MSEKNTLSVFDFNEAPLRGSLGEDGQPWFVAADERGGCWKDASVTPAPRDREIILTGNLVYRGEVECWAEPVCCRAHWNEETQDWHFATGGGMHIRQTTEDELVIHYWSELPWVGNVSHEGTKAEKKAGEKLTRRHEGTKEEGNGTDATHATSETKGEVQP